MKTIRSGVMAADGPRATTTRLHTPASIFVIHLRSDSDPSRQYLVGRVEHVKSGDSNAFVSLDELLDFMDHHTSEAADAER